MPIDPASRSPRVDWPALIARIEQEEPSSELWLAAFEAAHPQPPSEPWSEAEKWLALDQRFKLLTACKAWLDAADMLRPAGWLLDISEWPEPNGIDVRLVREADYDDQLDISKTEVIVSRKRGSNAEARARCVANLRACAPIKPATPAA